jgi:hypothetical protein
MTKRNTTITLGQIASARSGDKGNHANVGVVANSAAAYEFLRKELTTARVQAFFAGLGTTRVERFELPKVGALNFLLYNALAGGASRSLRIDTQGKLLGAAILGLELPRPENLDAMLLAAQPEAES